ncbi:hypothetical protein EYF80_031279 [Liparis tanakae]|uniref:Uncharacterized protein n=1 Tax=Liparis tanakae TaxID=230148 RepID=A0A4Z2GY73_9TELE|nr:hypothetical protein EYF80_031279 [Liparis tanakae]
MAVQIAEWKPGIPAWLEPEDMQVSPLSLNSLAKSETPDGLKHLKSQTELGTSREDGVSNTRPWTVQSVPQEETKTQRTSEFCSPCARGQKEAVGPMLDPPVAPGPRANAPATDSTTASGNLSNQKKCSSNSSHITSPTRDRPRVQINHPWMNIIHPGPWTRLPPAPPLVPAPRSKSVSWYRPRVPPPNPFGKEVDQDAPKEPADQTEASSGKGGTLENTPGDADAEVGPSEESAIKSTSDDVAASRILHNLWSVTYYRDIYVAAQVQTDRNASTVVLQVERRELEKHLEALEQKGVELEGNLRDLKNDSAFVAAGSDPND